MIDRLIESPYFPCLLPSVSSINSNIAPRSKVRLVPMRRFSTKKSPVNTNLKHEDPLVPLVMFHKCILFNGKRKKILWSLLFICGQTVGFFLWNKFYTLSFLFCFQIKRLFKPIDQSCMKMLKGSPERMFFLFIGKFICFSSFRNGNKNVIKRYKRSVLWKRTVGRFNCPSARLGVFF